MNFLVDGDVGGKCFHFQLVASISQLTTAGFLFTSHGVNTLQGTNLSLLKVAGNMIFLFHGWDM